MPKKAKRLRKKDKLLSSIPDDVSLSIKVADGSNLLYNVTMKFIPTAIEHWIDADRKYHMTIDGVAHPSSFVMKR